MILETQNGEKWITIMHRHVKIDGNGNIIGGLGGKFNGKPLQHATDHLASPEGAKKNKATEEKSTKKTKQALQILKNNPDLSAKEMKEIFMKNLGMTPGQASVYLSIAKKKLKKATAVDVDKKEDEKEEPKKGTPVPKIDKEEPKKEDKEKSSKKLHQAIEIFKSMPNASSKEVQAKFKSAIGMTPGMAAVYYHKIKKQFGNTEVPTEEPKESSKNASTSKKDENAKGIDKSVEDQVSQHIEKLHKFKQGVDLIMDIKKKHNLSIQDAHELFKKYKQIHSDAEGEKHIDDLLKNHGEAEAHEKLADKMNVHVSDAKEFWDKHPKVKEFNEKAGKHIANQYEKYNMGLKTQSQALKSITDETGMHFTKAEDMWADHKRKAEAGEEEKQGIANKIFASGKKAGLKYSEIAAKIKKELGYQPGLIKYVSNAEENHNQSKIEDAYDDFKKHEYMGHDDITKASTLQLKHGYSYDDSWDMLDKLKTHHEKQSQDHFEKAKEIIKKKKDADYFDHVDNVGKELGLNPYDAEQMTSRVTGHIKNENKKTAMTIYKNAKSWDAMPDDIIKSIEKALEIDTHAATKLYNIAKNSYTDEPEPSKSYKDVKNKVSDHNGGAQVFYNHDEDTHAVESEHVQRYHRRVELAKQIDGHKAFNPHEHLTKPYDCGYEKLDKKMKDMSKAVYDYTGSHYDSINGGLRQGTVYSDYKKTVKNMDEAFAHESAKTVKDTMVYRGYTDMFANGLEPGDILEDKGYMSTSANLHKAESWAAGAAAVVHILLPKGANALTVASISQHGSESEILLNRGAKLRIVKKEKRTAYGEDYGGVTLYAEYILDDSHSHLKEVKPKRKYTKKKVDTTE